VKLATAAAAVARPAAADVATASARNALLVVCHCSSSGALHERMCQPKFFAPCMLLLSTANTLLWF
jgi:hypothetical protein